jgi:hypothetical protein
VLRALSAAPQFCPSIIRKIHSPDSRDNYIFLLANSDLSFSGTRSDSHPSFNTLDLLNLSALK